MGSFVTRIKGESRLNTRIRIVTSNINEINKEFQGRYCQGIIMGLALNCFHLRVPKLLTLIKGVTMRAIFSNPAG